MTDRRRIGQWAASWMGAAGLGVANGIAREKLYAGRVGERAAHQRSTVTLVAALAGYTALLQRCAPIASTADAWLIGGLWASATVAFEFGFGHWVAGESWQDLLAAYDVRRGEIWALVPAAMLVLPVATRPA